MLECPEMPGGEQGKWRRSVCPSHFDLCVVLMSLFIATGCGCTYDPLRPLAERKIEAARAQIAQFKIALRRFRGDTGRFPSSQEGLTALLVDPGIKGWNGPYLARSVPADPWGRPYGYEYSGHGGIEPDIISLGADGKPGGEGENSDIVG
jgi:type II secretion system protein G